MHKAVGLNQMGSTAYFLRAFAFLELEIDVDAGDVVGFVVLLLIEVVEVGGDVFGYFQLHAGTVAHAGYLEVVAAVQVVVHFDGGVGFQPVVDFVFCLCTCAEAEFVVVADGVLEAFAQREVEAANGPRFVEREAVAVASFPVVSLVLQVKFVADTCFQKRQQLIVGFRLECPYISGRRIVFRSVFQSAFDVESVSGIVGHVPVHPGSEVRVVRLGVEHK